MGWREKEEGWRERCNLNKHGWSGDNFLEMFSFCACDLLFLEGD